MDEVSVADCDKLEANEAWLGDREDNGCLEITASAPDVI